MAIETKWPAVAPQAFTADGSQYGVIKVASAAGFKVKQKVVVQAATLPTLQLQVKRVIGPDTIIVGDIPTKQGEQSLTHRKDLSAYTILLGSFIFAEEQDKNKIKPEDILQAIYRQEPGTTIGVEIDDQYGNAIDSIRDSNGINRLAVAGNFTAEVDVTVDVDLDALTPPNQADPDNVLIAGSEDGTKAGLKHAARVDSELDLRFGISVGANKAVVNGTGELSVNDSAARTTLLNILATIDDGILVDDPVAQDILEDILLQLQAGGIMIGTEDGTPTGLQRVIVNNLRQQILATQDRQQALTWADITNKKNRRVTRMEYTSVTIPGFIVRKDFVYTLANGDYVVTNINWSII